MALGFALKGRLFIILDEENVDRMQQFDPFELFVAGMGPIALKVPLEIVVCYAHRDEHPKIARMGQEELERYLFRGFKLTESDGQRGKPYRTMEKI